MPKKPALIPTKKPAPLVKPIPPVPLAVITPVKPGQPTNATGQEIKYIQRRAAEYDARFVTVGPLVFFSTQTGDAWMLDPSDQLAARLARDGDPEPIEFQETDTDFAIDWKGTYHIESRAFVYADRQAGRIITILGYPTAKIAQLG
jgi:hypothetical protein